MEPKCAAEACAEALEEPRLEAPSVCLGIAEGTLLAICASVAPTRTPQEVEEMRRGVVQAAAAAKPQVFVVPKQVVVKYNCGTCGNVDQGLFMAVAKDGDVVCLGKDGAGCGSVVEEHHMFEGSQYRKFEGEEDKSHHGPAPNKNYSAAHNMRTNMVPMHGAGGPNAARLRAAYDQVELGLSNLGTDEKRTRVGYKDQMKKKAFDIIVHTAMNLSLHSAVVERAQELFAAFRDSKEHVQRFDAVVAACLIESAHESALENANVSHRTETPDARPLVTSHRAALLHRPVAAAKPSHRKRGRDTDAPAAAPRKAPQTRPGKDWAEMLGDLDGDLLDE